MQVTDYKVLISSKNSSERKDESILQKILELKVYKIEEGDFCKKSEYKLQARD